jgi:hypothetical protein
MGLRLAALGSIEGLRHTSSAVVLSNVDSPRRSWSVSFLAIREDVERAGPIRSPFGRVVR